MTTLEKAQARYLEAYRSQVTSPFNVTAPNFEEILIEEELKEMNDEYQRFVREIEAQA